MRAACITCDLMMRDIRGRRKDLLPAITRDSGGHGHCIHSACVFSSSGVDVWVCAGAEVTIAGFAHTTSTAAGRR